MDPIHQQLARNGTQPRVPTLTPLPTSTFLFPITSCNRPLTNEQNIKNPINGSSSKICRICFSGEESGKLIKFCHCMGTIEFCHQRCLSHWICLSHVTACELCGYSYQMRQRPVRMWRWKCPPLQPIEHFFFTIYLVAWLTLAGSIAWLCFVLFGNDAMYRESELAPLIYGLYSLIAVASLGIIFFESIFIVRPFLGTVVQHNRTTEILPYTPRATTAFLATPLTQEPFHQLEDLNNFHPHMYALAQLERENAQNASDQQQHHLNENVENATPQVEENTALSQVLVNFNHGNASSLSQLDRVRSPSASPHVWLTEHTSLPCQYNSNK